MITRQQITSFDTYWARIIGKIPAGYRPWFHSLGIITMPVVWGGVLGGLLITRILPEQLFATTLVIIILIPLGSVLKAIIRRKRPPTIYANHMKIKTSSFPSGHAYASMTAAGYLLYVSVTIGQWFMAAAFLLLIIIIGVSRVHLGAHYPSDVIGGWVLGALMVLTTVCLIS